MTAPTISVVVPTYNQAGYLEACLDSIMFQDYPNLEIVVVNDASTDDTAAVLERYAKAVREDTVSYARNLDEATGEIRRVHHPRYPQTGRALRILHNERNLGSTRTYNRGFEACTGAYCTYVASDDVCHPAMLSTLAGVLDRDEADFAYSDVFVVDDAGRILREFKLPDYSFEACFLDWYLCSVSKLYRRSLHQTIGFYDNNYLANDHELYLRFATHGVRFHHVPKTLYSIRSHDQRNTGVHSPANWSKLLDESRSLVRKAREWYAARAVQR